MTLIPSDSKDLKGPSATTAPNDSTHHDIQGPPPSYEETIEGASSSSAGPSHAPPPQITSEPGYRAPLTQQEKMPQSNEIKASSQVKLEGPLHILGAVKGSSKVTLSNYVTIEGKCGSSSAIFLDNNVVVNGKVSASGSVELKNNIKVLEKVDASGSISLYNGISVADKVAASGRINIDGGENGVYIGGKVTSSSGTEIKGWVHILGELVLSGSSKIQSFGAPDSKYSVRIMGRIRCRSSLEVEGNVTVREIDLSGTLTVNGILHVLGDLNVSGNVKLNKGSELIVDGMRTIHGSLIQLEE